MDVLSHEELLGCRTAKIGTRLKCQDKTDPDGNSIAQMRFAQNSATSKALSAISTVALSAVGPFWRRPQEESHLFPAGNRCRCANRIRQRHRNRADSAG